MASNHISRIKSQHFFSPNLYSRKVWRFPVFWARLTFVPTAPETWPPGFPSFFSMSFIMECKCSLFCKAFLRSSFLLCHVKVLSPSSMLPQNLTGISIIICILSCSALVCIFLLSAIVDCELLEGRNCVCFISVSPGPPRVFYTQ